MAEVQGPGKSSAKSRKKSKKEPTPAKITHEIGVGPSEDDEIPTNGLDSEITENKTEQVKSSEQDSENKHSPDLDQGTSETNNKDSVEGENLSNKEKEPAENLDKNTTERQASNSDITAEKHSENTDNTEDKHSTNLDNTEDKHSAESNNSPEKHSTNSDNTVDTHSANSDNTAEKHSANSDKDSASTADKRSSNSRSSSGQLSPRFPSPRRKDSIRMSRHLTKGGAKETDSPESNPNRFIEGLEEPIVAVSNNGFSLPEITIMEGQCVVFVYASSSSKLEIVQVIHDGDKLRPVIGGFRSSTVEVQGNQYEQQFNLEGEYKFALTGIRCTPLNVVVKRRVDLLADVNDDGFNPKIIYIDQGHSIKWQWKQCTVPHSVQEVKYIIDRSCFKKDAENAANVVRTVTGSYRQTFQRPGLYFFQTESAELNTPHICVVHVRESQREYRVEILDRSFQPMILLIEEGDRVWWYWDKFKCKKAHSVYQIEAPSQEHGEEDPYVPIQDGFRWSAPSKQGLMSYEFYQPGVYYFSDQNFQEAAEYIGTIIVKPKQKEHYINLTDKGFEQDVVYCQTGDRVWFQWDAKQFIKDKQYFTIREIEKCLNPTSKKPATPERDDSYLGLDDEAMQICTKVGLATTNYTTIGVYHYRSSIATDSMNTCSVVVNPGSKNHTIHLTDNGFEPKVITVRPDDRVWWVWQSGKKQHNIFQVSHQGVPIDGGFTSGMSRDPPSAFVHQFSEPGVFYFISSTLPKVFGAVVVSTQPRVYEVQVAAEIKPDPVTIKQNDIVCWIFRSPRTFDIAEVETADQVMADQFQNDSVTPRRCLNKAITKTGLIHFYSKSFRKQKKDSDNFLEDVRFSSVICDERFDNAVIRVDGQGFHPHFYYVCKGQSVLWTWKGNEEESHNIIHVSSADSDEPLNVIHGAKSFNSGKPVPNNSFLYTFDDAGRYTVASQGAPGHSCTIIVLNRGRKVTEPFISSKVNGGTVERYTKVELACETPDSKIYYTTDGSPPELHLDSAKIDELTPDNLSSQMYKPDKGVTLRESGLCFIRAMAVKEGFINSDIFTSRRFWVLSQDGDADKRSLSESTSSVDEQVKTKTKKDKKTWDWWSCSPTIKACFTSPGVIEVFWDVPDSHNLQLVKGYELFLNGISYCDMFPPENNSVNVSGLAGGRLYEIYVEAYSLQKGYSPLTSNKLMMKCPIMTNEGGPVISLERSEKPDALSIVWMSIDSKEYPISGYLVFLNDQQCGSRLVPDPDSNRCKVVIGGCEYNKQHKIYVIALPKADSEDARMSNIIEITLPADYSAIELPPENQRLDEEELYMEHLELTEGSGYLPAMDEKNHMASKDEIRERRLANAQPTSPHSARSLNASSGDDRNKTIPHAVVEVEESRYKAGVRPLKKKNVPSAKSTSPNKKQVDPEIAQDILPEPPPPKKTFRGKATSLLDRIHGSRQQSLPVPTLDVSRTEMRSPPPIVLTEPENGIHRPVPPPTGTNTQSIKRKILPLKVVGSIAMLKSGKAVDLTEQKKMNHMTFKTVSATMIKFLKQENILRSGIAPALFKQSKKFNFDWARFKHYIKATKAFEPVSSTTKTFALKAPSQEKINYNVQSDNFVSNKQPDNDGQQYGQVVNQRRTSVPNVPRGQPGDESFGYGPQRGMSPYYQSRQGPMYQDPRQGPMYQDPRQGPMYQDPRQGPMYQDPRQGPMYQDPRQGPMYQDPRQGPMYPDSRRASMYWETSQTQEYQNNAYNFRRLRELGYSPQECEQMLRHPVKDKRYTPMMQQSRSFDSISPDREAGNQACEYKQYLDVERSRSRGLTHHQSHSFDGASPDRIKNYGQRQSRNEGPTQNKSRARSRSRELSHDRPETFRSGDTNIDPNTEQFLREQGYYDRDFEDTGYWGWEGNDSENLSPPLSPAHEERYKQLPFDHFEPHRSFKEPPQRGRYDRFQDSSPESEMRQSRQDGFNVDFRDGKGNIPRDRYPPKPPKGPMTLKEFNKWQNQEKKFYGDKDYQNIQFRGDNQMDEDPGLEPLKTYGKMFRNMAVLDAIEVEDQSTSTDDNEKSTQTPRGGKQRSVKVKRGYDDEFVPPSLARKGVSGPARRDDESESETESETETESDSEETDSDDTVLTDRGSMVVMDAAHPYQEVRRSSKREREVYRRSSPRSSTRHVELDRDSSVSQSGHVPKPPSQPRHGRVQSSRRRERVAIIEVQESVELDSEKLTDREERRVAVPGDARGQMKVIDEGQLIVSEGDGILPAPSIMVESRGKNGLRVMWDLPETPDPNYKLLLYVVNIVGSKFTKEINSDISFECNLVEKGKPVRGVQHCWNIQKGSNCKISGLVAGMTYRLYVIANYTMLHGQQPCEVQTTSSVIYYTTVGPPKPPRLRVVNVDLYQALIEWDPPSSMHEDLQLKGYQIYVDNKPLGGIRYKDTRQMMINNLTPGKTLSVYVVAITKQASIESDPSRVLHITCPKRPPTLFISQQPSYKSGCVLIAWNRPDGHVYATNEEDVSIYGIYVDGKWYGEVKANKMGNHHGYQYILNDLRPEQSYDVSVKCIAGYKKVDPESQHIFCLSDSAMSNVLPVMAPAAPVSPKLRLEGLHPEGIDVTWQIPQQFGDAALSGYQMLKNGQLYGSIIPPDVNSLRIRDVSLGEKVTLQLIALTEHPVGKSFERTRSGEKDSGLGGSAHPEDKSGEIFLGERYAGCRPGAKLVVHYTGLVLAPSEVWCEQVSGHSALIVWNKGLPTRAGQSHLSTTLTDDEPKSHFVRPESYQVTWWPGDKPEDDINSDSTTDDHLLITNLRPRTTYTVVVEARKMEKYKDMDEEAESVSNKETVNAFILTSKSDSVVVKTASPPDPPSNLGILASSCSGLKIAWDPPREHGVEVIGIRIDAVSMNTSQPHHVSYNVIPDAKEAELDNLQEKTDYMLRVTAITDEYFDRLPDRHKLKKIRSLPRETVVASDDSPWLPNSSILAKTAGTEPPANVKVMKSSTSSMTLTWTPPIVYGSNKLTSVIVRWANVKGSRKKEDDLYLASHVNLLPTEDTVNIDGLVPGALYKIVVEAVVSVKTSLQADHPDKNAEKYRRTAHVMSKPLYARARAPTDPPRLYLTGYTQTTAQLYWEKPSLVSVIGKDEDDKPKYLRRYLEGYRLEINGKTYSCLGPNAQSCSLTKCKPGKQYHIVLVALTCTDDGKKARKKMYKGFYRNSNPQSIDYAALLDDDDNLDPSPSEPLEVFLPRNQDGYTATLDSKFTHIEDRDNDTFGDMTIHWTTQGDTKLLKQFNIVWYNQDDREVQTKFVSPDFRKTKIPVRRIKSVYDVTVQPVYFTDALPQPDQSVQIVIPGPPDAPEIFVKSVNPEEFVIEWGEPKLYGGVKVRGYQVYLNEKKAGNELSNSHRKAVIPCRPNKVYKVNIVALSANPEYSDSPKSNTLLINTSLHSPRQAAALDDWSHAEDQEMPAKVTQVSETSIHLDWSNFLETEGVEAYKIQWSSVAQPAQREVKLTSKDSSCVINNCLPGTTHFVRLVALDGDGQIKDKSKQITVQTSAPPDSPCLSVRACNFRYIAVQWDKPTTYGDALITGYKVYVNGIVEAILNAEQLSFTFTNGKWCQEYAFQVQALTAFEKLHSKVSEPLLVTWPGAQPPAIRRLPTHSSSNLRVGWEDTYLTEGIKVKHFRVCCIEEDTEKMVQSIGPIHPDTREAEFKHLKKGSYNIYLEVHLYGTSDIVCSDQIRVSPAPAPDPPRISVTVVGMEERLQLEKVTCDLVNKRDRLIRLVGHKLKEIGALTHPLRAEKNKDVIEGAHTLTRVEDLLEACFSALNHFTGQLIAHVSWGCPQSKSGIDVSGFRVLIDGKQYGSPMHDGINTVRIKLGMQQPVYKLSMLSLTDKPQGASEESNVVELNSEIFRPFSFYCYHSIHGKDVMWPHQGCCQYQDSIAYERQLAKKLANQGLLKRKVPPPSCSLLDIFDGEYKPLLGTHNKQFATAILFWTPWCISSQKSMANFARFARETASEYNFIAVTCGVNATLANERKQLIHDITSNGWREDRTIWHCTSQCASAIHEATNGRWKNTTAGPTKKPDLDNEKYMDLTELLGIAGVPTFLFLHQDGYISWHGRYSAFDYASFAAFMRHTFAEVLGLPCPVFKCDCCKNDTNVEDELIEPILKIVHDTPTRSATMKLTSQKEKRADSPGHISLQDQHKYADEQTVERLFLPRKQSPRRKKKTSKITVNQRPYSASTYVQLLKSPYMQKVVPSPKALNKLLRPMSGGPRLG